MGDQQIETKSTDNKRPLWQWILLYVVIAGLIYAGIYAAFLHKQNPSSYSNTTASTTKPTVQVTQAANAVYKMMTKGKLGMVMTDLKGMTLYTYAKDTMGASNCTGACLKNWPAYTAPSQTTNVPTDISVITRPDGTLQYAWKGMPLYYFVKDGDSGDAYGNGVGGVWSVITQTSINPTEAMQATSGEHAVTIQNFAFSPTSLTVKVGDKVTWTNQDSVGHSATADDGSFDTRVLGQGQSGSFTFTKPGTYTYHCSVHPMMKATITVE